MKTRIGNILIIFLFMNIATYAQEETELNSMEITDAIEDQFRFDHAVDVNKIETTVNEGVAELTGTVSNIKAKERATKLTQMVKGVRSVSNRITVNPPAFISDEGIRNSIEMALLNDPAADSYEVDVTVKNGKVTLEGKVDSFQEKQLCEDVAKSVNGVLSLENLININYKTDRADLEIENEIKEALKWSEMVDDGLIVVEVKNGNVKLDGFVGSATEKRNASWISWVAGVKSVDDTKLNVKWWAKDDDLRATKNVSYTDAEIASAIKDAGFYDPRVFSFNIEPSVNGGWVTLRGTVNNLKAKKAAENLANNTLGVIGVTNRIKVKGKMLLSDEEIDRKIEAALRSNSITEAWEIETTVNNGIVTLSGTVDSYTERNEAEWVASGIDGVSTVENVLDVTYPYSYYFYGSYPYYDWYHPTPSYPLSVELPNDKAIKRDVESELWWSPFVDASQVDVSVNNGVVTLAGTVDSWSEYNYAIENAWEGGAWSINNQLTF